MQELEDIGVSKEVINKLMDEIGLERSFTKLNIDDSGINIIVSQGFNPQRMKNNPRLVEEEDLREILGRIK